MPDKSFHSSHVCPLARMFVVAALVFTQMWLLPLVVKSDEGTIIEAISYDPSLRNERPQHYSSQIGPSMSSEASSVRPAADASFAADPDASHRAPAPLEKAGAPNEEKYDDVPPKQSVSLNVPLPPVPGQFNEALWKLALGAAVPRGDGATGMKPRLSSFESKRVGPKRNDGKAWKAGEAGCPPKPAYVKPEGGHFVQGDPRLTTLHFVHPPKSGGTTFGQVAISTACELNTKYRDSLDCCVDPADWCAENCAPIPDCKAIFGCSLCDCHHIPRLHRMRDADFSVGP